jgi:hypothetical protein
MINVNLSCIKNYTSKMIKKIFTLVLVITLSTQFGFALELESDNYKITGLSLNSGGGNEDSAGGFSLLTSIGDGVLSSRIDGSLYSLDSGNITNFSANVPLVGCFETTSNGSTNCNDTKLNGVGMVMLCGYGGCIDRARFEIDVQSNPTDTLYSIQIKKTTDTNWSYVDGNTFQVENESTHNIDDYLSKSDWEGTLSGFNVYGLTPNTTYELRIVALHGDLTQSEPSPIQTVTTASPVIGTNIDISDIDEDTSPPYNLSLGLLSTQSVNVGNDFVWFDLNSNSPSGIVMMVNGLNNGLYSNLANATIFSVDNAQIDLDTVAEGYGLLLSASPSEESLGPIVVGTNYDNLGNPLSNTVGGISSTPRELLNTSSNPILEGRLSFAVKTKISAGTPAASDYYDALTFTLLSDL